jgi:hypothetical protein
MAFLSRNDACAVAAFARDDDRLGESGILVVANSLPNSVEETWIMMGCSSSRYPEFREMRCFSTVVVRLAPDAGRGYGIL